MALSGLTPELRKVVLQMAAQPPPPGVKPDFEHPDNIRTLCNGLLFFYLAVSTILVAIRIYTQGRVLRKLQVEDYVLVVAWAVFAFAYTPVAWLINTLPIGVHQWNVTLGQFFQNLHYWYIGICMYGILLCLLKNAILLQIVRAFVPIGTRDHLFWASYILIGLNICWTIVYFFVEIFTCSPRAAFWDKTIVDAKCMDYLAVNVSGAVITAFSDLLILLIPQYIIYHLHLPWQRRLQLSAIFVFGIFAIVSAGFQVYYTIDLYQHRTDYTYKLALSAMWCNAQVVSGFIIAGLPSLPKFFKHIAKKPWFEKVAHRFSGPTARETEDRVKITTIGGGRGGRHYKKGKQHSDLEFHDLVVKTDWSDSERVSKSGGGSGKGHGSADQEKANIGIDDVQLNLNGLA